MSAFLQPDSNLIPGGDPDDTAPVPELDDDLPDGRGN